MSPGALPGFRDFYPTELAERAHIFDAWRDVARRFGFVEYDGPPLEPLELYTRKSGAEIVGQLYNFADKGDREISLRPEMTPTFARMVAARAQSLRKPVRWFSIPQLFRYERQQRGRLREHFQLNVDIVGEPDVTADAELLALAIEVMRTLGLNEQDVVARVSDRRLLEGYLASLGVGREQYPPVFAVIDKLDRQPADVSEEKLGELGLSARAIEQVIALPGMPLDGAWSRASTVDRRLVDDFTRYVSYLEALDVADWFKFDLTVVRGLAYYTGIVFELFDRKGELRAICGGGRYDDLLQALGGVDLPALGFGMGDVVLAELLRERGLMRVAATSLDAWVVSENHEALPDVMHVAGVLRRAGAAVEYPLRDQKPDKQRKTAQSLGARWLVTLPPDFAETQEVLVTSLERGSGTDKTPSSRLSLDALAAKFAHHNSTLIPDPSVA